MLKLRYLCVLMLCGAAFAQSDGSPASAPAVPASVVIANGTPVALRLTRSVSSAEAKPGDVVQFEVGSDMSVDGVVVIARHAPAFGTVTAVQQKRRGARRARLEISIDRVRAVSDKEVPLRARREAAGEDNSAMVTHAKRRVMPMILPPLFLQHGNQLELRRGARFLAYVEGNATLDRAQVEAHQPAGGDATVYVYRSRGEGDRGEWPVYCTGRALGRLAQGQALEVVLPPGEYWFRSSGQTLAFLHLRGGEEYYLRMVGSEEQAQMRIMPADTGQDEIYQLPPAALASFDTAPAMKEGTENPAIAGGGSGSPQP